MRLIDADELKKVGLKMPFDNFNNVWLTNRDIDQAPTVDAVPVRHGKWVEYPAADGLNQCSECGVLRFGESNYCPNCGAKMDGGRRTEE